MSVPRCGFCGAPTMAGAICKAHWGSLVQLLNRCRGLDGDLAHAIGKQGRHGESVSASTAPGIPINPAAIDAEAALAGSLRSAVAVLFPGMVALSLDGAAAMLRGHLGRLRVSWCAPVLLGEIEAAVPRAVAVTDTPRGRVTVRVPCPRCGGGPLMPRHGALECVACGEAMTVGEVRRAC